MFKLSKLTPEQQQRLFDLSMELGPWNSVEECVVVEHDWPNYSETWQTVQAVAEGRFVSRDALAAQVEARDALLRNISNWISKLPVPTKSATSYMIRIDGVIKETPAACLAQVKADAGRAGYVDGYEKCFREVYGTKPNADSVDEYADSYAERIKQGGIQ